MNREDVIALAKEAGISTGGHPMNPWSVYPSELERFAALVVEREREECAAICDKYSEFRWSWWKARADPLDQGASDAADELAQRIRSRT